MSDIHADFDKFAPHALPSADLVIIAGDVTNYGTRIPSEMQGAEAWFDAMTERYTGIFYVLGNHDIGVVDDYFDSEGFGIWIGNEGWMGCKSVDKTVELRAGIPEDAIEIPTLKVRRSDGVRVATTVVGVSMSPCFDMPDLEFLQVRSTSSLRLDRDLWNIVPPADIVVSHCPPLKVLDQSGRFLDPDTFRFGEARHIGSPGLAAYIERNSPRLVVCGHVHERAGLSLIGATMVVNCARSAVLLEMYDSGQFDVRQWVRPGTGQE